MKDVDCPEQWMIWNQRFPSLQKFVKHFQKTQIDDKARDKVLLHHTAEVMNPCRRHSLGDIQLFSRALGLLAFGSFEQ